VVWCQVFRERRSRPFSRSHGTPFRTAQDGPRRRAGLLDLRIKGASVSDERGRPQASVAPCLELRISVLSVQDSEVGLTLQTLVGAHRANLGPGVA